MDGSTYIPTIMVEVNAGKLIRITNPKTSEPRAARSDKVLLGTETLIGTESWILFEDGFGIRKRHLKELWDNETVEVKIYDEDGNEQDYFDG